MNGDMNLDKALNILSRCEGTQLSVLPLIEQRLEKVEGDITSDLFMINDCKEKIANDTITLEEEEDYLNYVKSLGGAENHKNAEDRLVKVLSTRIESIKKNIQGYKESIDFYLARIETSKDMVAQYRELLSAYRFLVGVTK